MIGKHFFNVFLLYFLFFGWATSASSNEDKILSDQRVNFSYSNIKINAALFHGRIEPQIKSIILEFNYLLAKTNPFFKQLAPVKKIVEESLFSYDGLDENCAISYGNNECLQGLHFLLQKANYLESLLLSLLDFQKQISISGEDYLSDFDLYFMLFEPLGQLLERTSYWHYLLLDFAIVLEGHDQKKINSYRRRLNTTIREMDIVADSLYFKAIKQEVADDYMMIGNDFIKVLKKVIARENDAHVFAERLEHLNFSWNDFYSKMTKSERARSDDELDLLANIMERWKNILRNLFD